MSEPGDGRFESYVEALRDYLRDAAARGELPVAPDAIYIGPPDSLDAAWAEAEAARPAGANLMVISLIPGRYGAYCRDAGNDVYDADGEYVVSNPTEATGHGPTPAAALRALAEKLRASRS